jgi:lauroyl/myristoyl acyltransferase
MDSERHDLDELLLAVRRPVDRCPLPRAELRVVLGTSPLIRRALPARLTVALAEAKGRALWQRSPPERERARRAMDALVAGTPRAHEVEELARAHVVEGRAKEALYWRPWKVQPPDRDSAAYIAQSLESGRGVILSAAHTGPYNLGVSVISRFGRTVYSATAWGLQTPTPSYWGRRVAHRRAQARARDERLLQAAGSYALIERLLEQGEVVSVFFAMPGSRETIFLGKPVMLAAGSARLAIAADALILPIRVRRAGHRVHVDACPPLDPRAFTSLDDLHAALAAVHERWILEHPAAMEDPNRVGAWEQGATAQAWRRPEPSADGRSPRRARA